MSREIDDQVHPYPFTPAEFERLYAFRQAVLAGFYSDQLPDDRQQSPELLTSIQWPGGKDHD
jgi:hypothetical protein